LKPINLHTLNPEKKENYPHILLSTLTLTHNKNIKIYTKPNPPINPLLYMINPKKKKTIRIETSLVRMLKQRKRG
jgi:hypothetical protein